MTIDARNAAALLMEIFEGIPKRYEQNEQMIIHYDTELTDLNHLIELYAFDAAKGYQLSKQIQENRRQRRRHKDENLILESTYHFVKKHAALIGGIRLVKEKADEKIAYVEKRIYHPRTETMKAAFEKAGIDRIGPMWNAKRSSER